MMKFNFRKIASAAASVAMMGSTVALAAAANYPAPFVTGGNADVGLVYGSTAASSDLVAAIDITNSLQGSLGGTGDATTAVSGEAYALFSSGENKIYVNDSLNRIRTTVTKNDLPTVLADTDLSGFKDTDLTHSVKIGNNPRLRFTQQPTSDDDPAFNIELSTATGNYLYNATVDFDNAVQFNHSETEGESFNMFGQDLTVGSATDGTDLVMFRASSTIFLDSSSNPSESVIINDETYTVELVAASDTAATIRLTDSAGNTDQKEINEAASKKILGIEVSVNTADESDALNSISAEVIVGANKLKMTDNNEVLFGTDEDTLDGTKVDFTSGNPGNITQLVVQVVADDSDRDAILAGEEFVDPVFGSFKVSFAGLTNDDVRETIEVKNSGDDKMDVKFTNHDGFEKNMNWVYNVTNSAKGGEDLIPTNKEGIFLADSSGDLIHVRERALVNRSQYIMVGNEDNAHLLEVKTITNGTTGFNNDDVKFEDVFSGEQPSVSITAEGVGTLNVGGNSYAITYLDTAASDNNMRTVRVDDPNSAGEGMNLYPTMETIGGAKVAFYQPLQINMNNWRGAGAGTNMTSIRIPDGDGYTAFAVAAPDQHDSSNWTFGGTAVNASLALSATTLTSGPLVYNITSAAQSVDNSTYRIFLNPPNGGQHLTKPALIVFEEKDDNDAYHAVVIDLEGIGTSGDGLGVNAFGGTFALDTANTNMITWESDSDISSAATLYGSVVTLDASESDQKTGTLSYPADQIYAEVYLAANDAAIAGGGSGGTGAVLGSVTVKDTEVSSVSGNNLIVIGGSCVNSVAASLLGSDVPMCGSDWEDATGVGSGSFLVQTFASPFTSGKVATMVAGYNAGDTENAGTYFRTQAPTTDEGTKYVGTSATSASLVTEEV